MSHFDTPEEVPFKFQRGRAARRLLDAHNAKPKE